MSMQVIWKIKHQNLNFQGKKIYAHKSYYQLMGFVQIPTDLFTKFTPWCLDEYIMWSEPVYTFPVLALSPACQVPCLCDFHGRLADTSACMSDIYIFSEIRFSYYWMCLLLLLFFLFAVLSLYLFFLFFPALPHPLFTLASVPPHSPSFSSFSFLDVGEGVTRSITS